MTSDQIRVAIRESVHRITGISPDDVHDASTYREDLRLDSLSLLELTVDLEYTFRIKIPEERLQTLTTVSETIRAVQDSLPAAN